MKEIAIKLKQKYDPKYHGQSNNTKEFEEIEKLSYNDKRTK